LYFGFVSTLTFDLHEYEDLKEQKKNIVDQVKRKHIYIEKKKDPKKKWEVQHNFLLQFYLWFINIYLQSVFLLESPCCLI